LAVQVLHPGDVGCAGRGDRLETLLGSCVAIVLTDPRRTIGAMCHIVHARPSPHGRLDTAYGDGALAAMYSLMQAQGIVARLCDAWVFGGGNMFPSLVRDRHVGQGNVAWAFDALQEEGIRVLNHDVGGTTYRRLGWTVGEGDPEVVAFDV
jgi:chemotaxis protein CheD